MENGVYKGSTWTAFVWERLTAHPFLWTGFFCFVAAAVFSGGSDWRLAPQGLMMMGAAAVLFLCSFFYSQKQRGLRGIKTVLSRAAAIFAVVLFFLFAMKADHNVILLFVGGAAVLGVFFYRLCRCGRMTWGKVIGFLFILSFLLRLCYVLYTSIYTRQHDVESWDTMGHLGYMRYLYENHAFYDGDVREAWQFYHPPLHHIIGTIWLAIQTECGLDFWTTAGEGLQFLSLFYSSACIIISYKLFRHFHLRGVALAAAFSIVAFHPTFIFLSGAANNDILSIAFALGAILCTVQWYRRPTFGKILQIALCIGLGMMTKLSVWMVAPGVALVFLIVLIRDRKKLGNRLLQFVSFGIVCVPIGLWWEVRNYVLHRVPFTYVPKLGADSWQYIGDFSAVQRLFDFRPFHFNIPYPYQEPLMEYNYNPTIELFKTAMFDEARGYEGLDFLAYALLFLGMALAVAAFIAMVVVLVRRRMPVNGTMKAFFAAVYLVYIVSYYLFCFDFAQICTQNIRYVVPLIVLGAFFVGMLQQKLAKKRTVAGTVVYYGMNVLTAAFCVISVLFYMAVSMY